MGMRIPNKEERGVTRGRQWLRKKRGRGIGGQNTRNGDKKLSSTEKVYSLVFAKNTSTSRYFAGVLTKYSAHGGILGKDR